MSIERYPTAIPPRALDYPTGTLPGLLPNEAELTAGVTIIPGRTYGFFTDTSLCIGCKACEVACKEWNALPADNLGLTGDSYDNTAALSATTWRHVAFVEQISTAAGDRVTAMTPYQSNWLMMSDICKHCERAACLEVCPTGALFYTEFGTVVVQQDICNGCGYCVPACPFGVIGLSHADGKAHKCTLCYDRLKGGLEPACAKACPTDSIQFGELHELHTRASQRLATLQERGVPNASLYGAPGTPGTTGGIGPLHAFFLLLDRPERYGLPVAPTLPTTRTRDSLLIGFVTLVSVAAGAFAVFRGQKNHG